MQKTNPILIKSNNNINPIFINTINDNNNHKNYEYYRY